MTFASSILVERDDHVGAVLGAAGLQGAEATEERRDIDHVSVSGAGREIRDPRPTGPVLDDNEIIAAAEEKRTSRRTLGALRHVRTSGSSSCDARCAPAAFRAATRR